MPNYTHILFDHDGVLVDTEQLYFQATREILADLGVQLGLEGYLSLQAVGGNAWQPLLDSGAAEEDVADHRVRRNIRYQELLQSCPIDIPGVEDVLAHLAERFTLAIVTTARQADFDLIHQRRSIVSHMDLILTNKDYARSKPAPDPYLKAVEHFGIAAQQALVVEDSERGLKAAVAAQIDCAVVHHPFTAPQDFSEATYRLDKLADLLTLVE